MQKGINQDPKEKLITIRPVNNLTLLKGEHILDHDNSLPPFAFDIDQPPAQLEVFFTSAEGEGTLEAVTGDGQVLFSGKYGPESRIVNCMVSFTNPGVFKDSVHWQITNASGKKMGLGKTDLEIYWLSVKHLEPSLRRKGVSLETLQNIFSLDKKSLQGGSQLTSVIPVDSIVRQVFSRNPPRYDTDRGAPHFVTIQNWDIITLHYKAYLAASKSIGGSILNCYDAAAVLQYLLKNAGQSARYCYMAPFGYLKLTQLIGRGKCNNPFFGSDTSRAVVNDLDTHRTSFRNHAFVFLPSSKTVADACAGPHLGTESKTAYVMAAVDAHCPNPGQNGNAGNIAEYNGVNKTDLIESIHDIKNFPVTNNFIAKMDLVNNKIENFSDSAVAAPWPSPVKFLPGDWKVIHQEIVPGSQEVLGLWMLQKDENMIMVKIYVSSRSNDLAFNRFLSLGSLSQRGESAYEKGPEGLGHYSAMYRGETGTQYLWIYYNIVFDIFCSDPNVDILSVARAYFQLAEENRTDDISSYLPRADINHPGLNLKTGNRITFGVPSGEDLIIDHTQTGESIKLVSNKDHRLVFEVINSDVTELEILVVNKNTLLVQSEKLNIQAE